ncbi:MAG: metallophosphoesterase [Proteobacteria bacterium]|nr:metallophosphoesterase [Pseudomonadota bacterium]
MVLFLLVSSIIYLALNYYIYSRITGGLNLSIRASKILLVFFILATFSFIPAEILSRHFEQEWIRPFLYLSFTWLGVTSIAIAVFVIVDVLRIFIRLKKFRYYATVSALFLIALTSGYCLYNQAKNPVIKEIKIPVSKLPPAMNGFTVVQLSDLHLDMSKSESFLKDLVLQTLALKPDLIVITGDMIDTDICKLNDFCKILKRLKAKYGVYAVTGNHEFYAGIPLFMEIATNSDIRVLRNTNVLIADAIELVGIDDAFSVKRFEKISVKESLLSAFKKVDFTKPVLLLSHQPGVFDLARSMGADIQLSGHTHAGQLPPVDLLVQFLFKYPFGLYKKDTSYLYTTCGSAFWGPPMRMFSKPEIVKVILIAKKS